jgi:uncharacterized protein (TIGR02300 family)
MARDLGAKHLCFNCGTKFYDLRKPEPICPKCGADQREATGKAPPVPERRRPRPAAAQPAEPAEAAESEGEAEAEPADEAAEEDEEDEAEEEDDEG